MILNSEARHLLQLPCFPVVFSKIILPDVVPGYVGGILVDEPQFKGVAVLKHQAIRLSTAHFMATNFDADHDITNCFRRDTLGHEI